MAGDGASGEKKDPLTRQGRERRALLERALQVGVAAAGATVVGGVASGGEVAHAAPPPGNPEEPSSGGEDAEPNERAHAENAGEGLYPLVNVKEMSFEEFSQAVNRIDYRGMREEGFQTPWGGETFVPCEAKVLVDLKPGENPQCYLGINSWRETWRINPGHPIDESVITAWRHKGSRMGELREYELIFEHSWNERGTWKTTTGVDGKSAMIGMLVSFAEAVLMGDEPNGGRSAFFLNVGYLRYQKQGEGPSVLGIPYNRENAEPQLLITTKDSSDNPTGYYSVTRSRV